MDATRLLAGLTASQREAVTTTASPLRIVAGAGSGKTRVLTRRIAYRCEVEGIDPRHVLTLTFTRKAAGELGRRLRDLGLRDGVTAGTFHAIAYAALRGAWADHGTNPPTLLERKARIVGEALEASARTGLSTLAVVQEIEWAKARLIAADAYVAAALEDDRLGEGDARAVAATFATYEETKRRRNLVDFDDLLGQCVTLMARDKAFAAAQHWRHRHVFVDEFQDVNPLQFALLRGWSESSGDVCVVGDPNQAIYGWNGADSHFMTGFADLFPGASTVVLEDNFRSTPEIVSASRSVLRPLDGEDGLGVPSPEVHRDAGRPPEVVRYDDDESEATGVARNVRDAHRPGGSWSEQAVLARTNAQLGAIERALRHAGVPTVTRQGARLVDRPEIKGILGRLRANAPSVSAVLADVTDELLDERDDEVRAGLNEFVTLGREYLDMVGEPAGGTREFAAWLQALSPWERAGERAAGVELTTFHAAKGLEWRVVHVIGVEKGFVPIGHARRPEQVEEERRLLHVAMSRAEDELSLSWAATRRFGDKVVDRQRSPLLGAMGRKGPGRLVDRRAGDEVATPAVSTISPTEGLSLARQSLASSGAPAGVEDRSTHLAEEAVRLALGHWRDQRARAAESAASAVMPDGVLDLIARSRPATVEELAALDGVGELRARRFGDEIIGVLRDT